MGAIFGYARPTGDRDHLVEIVFSSGWAGMATVSQKRVTARNIE